MFYTHVVRPILFKTDPEWIHRAVVGGLNLVSRLWPINFFIQKFCLIHDPRLQVRLGQLSLPNPVGLPAGFDKYIEAPYAHAMIGFGFAELGSITFGEQPGNPKPRLWRIPKDKGFIVYYGLSNCGAEKSKARLEKITRRPVPLGISIAPTTGLAINEMAEDYIKSLLLLNSYADYLVLNISCPNVATCDVFSQIAFIKELITKTAAVVKAKQISKDIFVKIGPDMNMEELDQIIDACVASKLTGIIATNLIKKREGVVSKSSAEEMNHPGGLSGKLVEEKSNAIIRHIYERAGDKLKIIGVGGIFSAQDAYKKIKLGATAVQVFTGWIYNGPLAVRQINLGLLRLLERDGLSNITAAVGCDVGGVKK